MNQKALAQSEFMWVFVFLLFSFLLARTTEKKNNEDNILIKNVP